MRRNAFWYGDLTFLHRTLPTKNYFVSHKRSMSTSPFPCPTIPVLYWNAWNVYVECPYCEDIHRHGVALPGRRTSHCCPGGQYEFVFPIDESSGLVGYEIDKRRARFVNVSLQKCNANHFLGRDECELDD